MNPKFKEAEQFLQSLNAAWKNVSLYSSTHPASTAVLQRLRGALERLLGGGEQITLGLLHDTLVLNGLPLTAKAELSGNLVTRLRYGDIQGITFMKGCTMEELRHFVEALGRDVKNVELEQDLKNRGISHILLVYLAQEQSENEDVEDPLRPGAMYRRALQSIRKVFHEARRGKVPSIGEVQRTVEDLAGGILRKHSLMGLTMIKGYDEYLFNHSVNVGILAMTLGATLGLDRTSLRELGLGALLHDLGKIHIPDLITNAPRKLTEEELEVIKRHPVDGVKMLEQMGVSSVIALRVVKEHHVRFDRTGYPTLAPDEEVHPCSMMVTIADVYDAMTTARPYRGAFHPTQAIEEIKALSGSTFDPEMLETFIDMLGIYPPGTPVHLTMGEIDVVTRDSAEELPVKKKQPNRRRNPRFSVGGWTKGRVTPDYEASLVDISLGGARIEHAKGVQLGTISDLDLPLLGRGVRLRCRVAWSVLNRPEMQLDGEPALIYHTGLEFVDVPEKTRQVITEYIQSIAKEGRTTDGGVIRRSYTCQKCDNSFELADSEVRPVTVEPQERPVQPGDLFYYDHGTCQGTLMYAFGGPFAPWTVKEEA